MRKLIRQTRNFVSQILVYSWVNLYRLPNKRWIVDSLIDPQFLRWASRNFSLPSPQATKMSVLKKYEVPNSTWIETGTFVGSTTRELSKRATRVISIEPSSIFYDIACQNLHELDNVELINGSSENVFDSVVQQLDDSANFWLDGHYSGGDTFQGELNSPIAHELNVISAHVSKFNSCSVFIDDVRCFIQNSGEEYEMYPNLTSIIEWASALGFEWTIEHDIFVAWKLPKLSIGM